MDNRVISVQSIGKSDFGISLNLLIDNSKTIGYRISNNTLILYKFESKQMTPLPYAMNADDTVNFAWGWLENNNPDRSQPDHDGDNKKGFRIYNESWGHVAGEYQAYAAITPIWAMYGK